MADACEEFFAAGVQISVFPVLFQRSRLGSIRNLGYSIRERLVRSIENMVKLNKLLGVALVVVALNGCAASPSPPTPGDPPRASGPETPAVGAQLKVTPLDQLWEARRTKSSDFPIGLGDIIDISVPGMALSGGSESGGGGGETLDSRTVRVDGMGNITLPILGRIHVAGLTEEQLRSELRTRLQKYMYNPEVQTFVKSYSSREVAVSGEVHSPGMYTVNGPSETIHDLIIRAGGTTDSAAPRLILTPARAGGPNVAEDPNPAHPNGRLQEVSLPAQESNETPGSNYIIDLTKGESGERYLNIPVRPGDTIYVPRTGSASIIGWVHSPKTIDVGPGMTVLSAVSAAGGPLFAADPTKIKILRQGQGHETQTVMVNLDDIKVARTPDVPLQANDVVEVPYSALRIPGYALYYGVQGFVNFAPAAIAIGAI